MNPVLYLAGDGVYNLLEAAHPKSHPGVIILACQEDLLARGIQAGEVANVTEDFYRLLVVDMASNNCHIYVF